jgi:hypothetical protein
MERFEPLEGEAAFLRALRDGRARSSRTSSSSRPDRNREDCANEPIKLADVGKKVDNIYKQIQFVGVSINPMDMRMKEGCACTKPPTRTPSRR